ncbi:MAG: hypothetical protein CMI03_01190 [Oceanospirillaceae bacterium]|nr:hypothetical protein [Thalassolituus sp.]MAS24101.1 hypothetical protein [Oceanospirillaceae bacterium]MBS51356.1 hypothetical protein [Oceanospirillaceae bacterium]
MLQSTVAPAFPQGISPCLPQTQSVLKLPVQLLCNESFRLSVPVCFEPSRLFSPLQLQGSTYLQ